LVAVILTFVAGILYPHNFPTLKAELATDEVEQTTEGLRQLVRWPTRGSVCLEWRPNKEASIKRRFYTCEAADKHRSKRYWSQRLVMKNNERQNRQNYLRKPERSLGNNLLGGGKLSAIRKWSGKSTDTTRTGKWMFDEKPEWSPRFRQTKKCGRCSGVHK
jgi:hypothetical protein